MSARVGGVLKLWYGAGEDSVHSSPLALYQGRESAGFPLRIQSTTMYTNKTNDSPKEKAPIEEI